MPQPAADRVSPVVEPPRPAVSYAGHAAANPEPPAQARPSSPIIVEAVTFPALRPPRRLSRPPGRGGRRTTRRLLAAAMAGAAVFAAGSGFGQSARIAVPIHLQFDNVLVGAGFGINQVTVSGNRYQADSEIYAALGLDQAGSLLAYDVAAARQRIEALPWVRTATIARLLPDRLSITIEERRPMAIWAHGGRTALVDRTGRVLAHLTAPYPIALPRMAGAGAPVALAALLAAIEPHAEIHARLETARRVGERRWTLELTGGVQVHLPADREGEALLRLARQNRTGGLLEKTNQIIDLRQDGIVAVRSTTSRPAAVDGSVPPGSGAGPVHSAM